MNRNLSYAQKRLIYENAAKKPIRRFGSRPTWGWEANPDAPRKRVVKRRKRK